MDTMEMIIWLKHIKELVNSQNLPFIYDYSMNKCLAQAISDYESQMFSEEENMEEEFMEEEEFFLEEEEEK